MANVQPPPSPVTGRTPWDAVTEIAGRLGPLVLAAAVFVGGSMWFYIEFAKINQEKVVLARQVETSAKEAEARTRAQYEEQLRSQLNSLLQVSKHVGEQQEQQIKIASEFHELHETKLKQLTVLEEKTRQLIADSREAERKAGVLQEQANRALAEQKRTQEDLDTTRSRLRSVQAELEAKEKQLAVKERELDGRATQIQGLQSELVEFASRFIDSDNDVDADLIAVARTIVASFGDPAGVLVGFAADAAADRKMLEKLVGLPDDKLQAIVASVPGFDFWFRAGNLDSRAGEQIYFGVIGQESHALRRIAILSTRENKVVDIEYAQDVIMVDGPSETNWLVTQRMIASRNNGRVDLDKVRGPIAGDGSWDLARFIQAEDRNVRIEGLQGDMRPLRIVSFPDLKVLEPELYGRLTDNRTGRIRIAQVERAQAVTPDNVLGTLPDGFPDDARAVLAQTLVAVVARDPEAMRRYVLRQVQDEQLGELASLVLGPDFAVTGAERLLCAPLAVDRPGPSAGPVTQQAIQSAPPPPACIGTEAGASELVVHARYAEQPGQPAEGRIRLTLRRSGDQLPWALAAITDLGADGRVSAVQQRSN